MINPLKHFLWTCSGATISILKTKECETEHSKYVGVGAAVFLTGVLAGVAASYAFSTVFDSISWAVAFGAFWGVMIFNLDRYLVLSIRKKAPNAAAAWGERLKNWGGVFILVAPRMLLAALLAMVIAKPLELLIFKDEILVEMQGLQAERATEVKQSLDDKEIERLDKEIQQLKDQNKKEQEELDAATRRASDENAGLISGHPPGMGTHYGVEMQNVAEKKREVDKSIADRNKRIDLLMEQFLNLSKEKIDNEQKAAEKSHDTDGLATHLQAFSRLTQKNSVVEYANLLIMAIILILEVAPILTKVYADYGPYDKFVDIAEQKVYLAKQQELDDFKTEMEERRDSYGRRKEVLTDIQKWVMKDTMDETQNAKQGSESQVNLRRARINLIEQATVGLTHKSDNGNEN
jgi:hypothetical protein